MTYQIRPLFHEVLQVIRKAGIPFDPLLPAQVRTITTVNRLQTHSNPFIGMAIPPGRINTLLRPKTFLVQTTRLDHHAFITTYNVVVMDAAGDLRLVEDITTDDTEPGWASRFVDQVADLVEEQAAYNNHAITTELATLQLLHDATLRIAQTARPKWAGWIAYILEGLQNYTDPATYDKMLTELLLAIETRQLEGRW